ncbi:MAG: oligosaccharide flippase family protein [Burkholderiaceae bacterium]|nr:oligosaccharide flippase family protein [Burkholderiaceae bacterium]
MDAQGLWRATLTLVAGGSLAQLVPLALAPLLTRQYSPDQFGTYHLFAAVLVNAAVVACARYEFALPMAADDAEAGRLRALCLRILTACTLASVLPAWLWAVATGALWPLWLPPGIALLGLVSLASLNASRERRFRAMAVARVVQHGGGAALQALFGWWQAGVTGLIVGPLLAAAAALAWLRLPLSQDALQPAAVSDVARKHRDFPVLNTPHAFLGALQDTVSVALIAGIAGPAAAGAWGLCMRVLKAPATLVGGNLSQALYPQLSGLGATLPARAAVAQTIGVLGAMGALWTVLLWWAAPALFVWAFGDQWHQAGDLGRALSLYIGMHFVASPLAVVTMAWNAQRFALRLALVGQLLFVVALAAGLLLDGLVLGGWIVSAVMALYFGWYFARLLTWPVHPTPVST